MSFRRFFLSAALFIAVLGGAIVFYPRVSEGELSQSVSLPADGPAAAETAPEPEPTPGPEVDDGPITATLAVAGDIVVHMPLNDQARDGVSDRYDYTEIFGGSVDWIRRADYALCCVETTFTDSGVYSGYPSFSSPHDLAGSLRDIGFDLIFTASNHCMDMDKPGLDRTLEVLEEHGLDHVGTYRTPEEFEENHGVFLADVGGISVAFLDYTYGTNGIPVTNCPYAVNLLVTDYLYDQVQVDYGHLERSLSAARDLGADLIAVGMHWGYEYHTAPNDVQREVADFLFANGADLILGGHPHAPQPMERRTVTDGDGNTREGFIVYSLGNYISCQKDRYTNLTGVLNITLEKSGGETVIRQVSYAPMFMMDAERYGMTDVPRFMLLDIYCWLDRYEAGDAAVTDSLYQALTEGLDDLHAVFGSEFDNRLPRGDTL